MAKKKKRNERWEYRGVLKVASNRHNSLRDQHPQVRRVLQESVRKLVEERERIENFD